MHGAILPALASWCLAKQDKYTFTLTFNFTSKKLRNRNTVVRILTRLRTALYGLRISPKRPDRIWSPPSLLMNRYRTYYSEGGGGVAGAFSCPHTPSRRQYGRLNFYLYAQYKSIVRPVTAALHRCCVKPPRCSQEAS